MDLGYQISYSGPVVKGEGPKISNEVVEAWLYEATTFLEAQVKHNTPLGVGGKQNGLYATIHGEVIEKGGEIQKGIVAHQSAYGDPAERGRRPGKMAPSEVLVRWVELKFGVDEKEAKRIAFFVRRKIMKRGTKGAAMFFKALDEGWPALVSMADRYGLQLTDKLRGQ